MELNVFTVFEKQKLVTTTTDRHKKEVFVFSLHGPTRHFLLVAFFPIVFYLVHASFKAVVGKDVMQGF